MARAEPTGSSFESRGRYFALVALPKEIVPKGKGRRRGVLCPTAASKEEAKDRAKLATELVAALVTTDNAHRVEKTIELCTTLPLEKLPEVRKVVDGFVGGRWPAKPKPGPLGPTFGDVRKDLTSGDLHKRFPHVIQAVTKEHAKDIERKALEYIEPVLGPLPIAAFTLDHALAVMAKIPDVWAQKRTKRKLPETPSMATMRHVAQILHRVIEVAVYPLRLLEANPLPRGFLPKLGNPRAGGFLYPDEEAKVLALPEAKAPLVDRLLVGFLTREGCRKEEAASLEWSDTRAADAKGWIDLERGKINLADHKTVDSSGERPWNLDPAVASALAAWRALRPRTRFVFDCGDGTPVNVDKLAERLRDYLTAAGVNRPELHVTTATRHRMYAHDLRAVFVTTSLAQGRSEHWIRKRTGHGGKKGKGGSEMIARYTRQAEDLAEGGDAALRPLHLAIPELAVTLADTSPEQSAGSADRVSEESAEDPEPVSVPTIPYETSPSASYDPAAAVQVLAPQGVGVQVPSFAQVPGKQGDSATLTPGKSPPPLTREGGSLTRSGQPIAPDALQAALRRARALRELVDGEARPIAAALVADLERLAGDGADVTHLADARARRRP